MADGSTGGVGVRLFVEGAAVVKATFSEIADSGRKMWAEIAAGEKSANPGLRGLSATVGEGKDRVREFAGEAGGLGRVLSSTGAYGVAAAAAIGGFAVAMEKTKQSLEWVKSLDEDSRKLQIGAEALQKWRFAAQEATGDGKNFDTALAGLESAVGKVTEKVGRYKIIEGAFEKVGISREQLVSIHSAADLIDLIADKWDKLGQSDRAALADKFGLRPILPLLNEGKEKIDEMREEAERLGVVIDNQTVSSMAELGRQVHVASQIIDVQLKDAFLSLAPILAQLARDLADFTRQLVATFAYFKALDQRSVTELDSQIHTALEQRKQYADNPALPGPFKQWALNRFDDRIQTLSEARQAREKQNDALDPVLNTGGVGSELGNTGGGRGGNPGERLKHAGDELNAAILKVVDAQIATTRDAVAKLNLELTKLDAEQNGRHADLRAQVGQYASSKGKSGLSASEAAGIQAEEDQAFAIRRANLEKQIALETQIAKITRDRSFLEEDLKVAQAAGNKDLIADLERQIDLLERREALLKAGASPADAALGADLQESRLDLARNSATFDPNPAGKDAEAMRQGFARTAAANQASYDKARDEFGKVFAEGIESELRGGGLRKVLGAEIQKAAEQGFENAGKVIFDLLGSIVKQAFSQGGDGSSGGNIFSTAFHAVGSFFSGGGHAGGGDLASGFAYRTAEGGATELAMIGASGSIFSQDQTVSMLRDAMGGGGSSRGAAPGTSNVNMESKLVIPRGFVSQRDLETMFRNWHAKTVETSLAIAQQRAPESQAQYKALKG